MEKNQKSRKSVVWFILIISIVIIIFSGYKLWKIQQIYIQGDQNYVNLREQILYSDKNQELINSLESETTPSVYIPPIFINFDALEQVNNDSIAWLYCPNTVIDYPVMRADDYNQYLYHLPDGTKNVNGSLFLDYNCSADFSGRLNIIYGHHMKSGKMFGSLEGYKKQEYFEQNPYIYLYTRQGNYRVDLTYGCIINAGEWRERAFMYEANLEALLTYAASKTTFDSNIDFTDNSNFVVFSTCSYDFDNARYIVIGVLRPEYGE